MQHVPLEIEKKLKAVIRRIEEAAAFDGLENYDFNDSTAITALSKASAMSERSLRDWFKVYTGQKISHYVNKRRMEYAARIFRLFPDTSKSDVSRIIGLSSPQSLYPFMRKNGVTAIDELRGQGTLSAFKFLSFRFDTLPECIMFYTLKETVYQDCASSEFEIENWEEIHSFVASRFPSAIIIGDVGFAIDRYIKNQIDEGIFIAGILCKNISKNLLTRDLIGDIGWRCLPAHEYAVFTHQGVYDDLSDSYFSCMQTLKKNNIQIHKSQLIMERYLNSPLDTSIEELLTEIWVPIIQD